MKALFCAGGKCAVANQFTGDQCLSPIAACDTNQVRCQLIVVKIPPDKTLIPNEAHICKRLGNQMKSAVMSENNTLLCHTLAPIIC